MADDAIKSPGGQAVFYATGSRGPHWIPYASQVVLLGMQQGLPYDSGSNAVEGHPTTPSQQQPLPGILRDILWLVEEGTNIFSIDCLFTGEAPRVIIRSDVTLGFPDDIILVASSTVVWQTISTTLISPARGVFAVWRQRTDIDPNNTLFWDNLRTRVI